MDVDNEVHENKVMLQQEGSTDTDHDAILDKLHAANLKWEVLAYGLQSTWKYRARTGLNIVYIVEYLGLPTRWREPCIWLTKMRDRGADGCHILGEWKWFLQDPKLEDRESFVRALTKRLRL